MISDPPVAGCAGFFTVTQGCIAQLTEETVAPYSRYELESMRAQPDETINCYLDAYNDATRVTWLHRHSSTQTQRSK